MSVFCSNTLIFAPKCWKCILRGPDFKIFPETCTFAARFFLLHILQGFCYLLKILLKPWSCCNLTNFCFVTFFSAWLFCSTVKVFWSTSFTKNTSRCSAWFYVLTNWQQHIFIDTDIKFQLQNYWEIESNWPPRKQNKKIETVGWSENTHIASFSHLVGCIKVSPRGQQTKKQ